MLSLNESLSYYLYPGYVKMNGGIELLCSLVRSFHQGKPLSGNVYLFLDKRRSQIKMLRWDGGGFILYQKRLEIGTFAIPRFNPSQGWHKMEWWTFVLMMEGVSARSVKVSKRLQI